MHGYCVLFQCMTFPKTLQKWRKRNNYTQQQAAAFLNVPFRTFQEWLGGRMTPHPDRQSVVEKRMKDLDYEVPSN